MVDSISAKTITANRGATPIARATPIAAAPSPTGPAADAVIPAAAGGLAASLAASAPIDGDRVAAIKKAIAEGRFPILPATIADRLIALKLQWKPSDAPDHHPA